MICFAQNKKKKLSCCNENIQHCCFKKKLRWNIIRKLKFNGANNRITFLFALRFYNFFAWIRFMKRIKRPRAETCDVTIVYIKSLPYYIYMTMLPVTSSYPIWSKNNLWSQEYSLEFPPAYDEYRDSPVIKLIQNTNPYDQTSLLNRRPQSTSKFWDNCC